MIEPPSTRTFIERTPRRQSLVTGFSGPSDTDPDSQPTVLGSELPTLIGGDAPHPPTEVAAPQLTVTGRPAEIVRYGPGVPVSAPASSAGTKAEQVWRNGRLPEPPRTRRRLRRVASGALTVVLLAAACVVMYLRFHHAPFKVTGVAVTREVKNGCAVDVTGRIATSGSAGTVSYQWVLKPQLAAPQPVSQSVVAGQDAVYVTAALQAQGHGSVARTVTLQVLGPGSETASTRVVVGC
jgi:hypothetical protein